jgi:hypothetical protein
MGGPETGALHDALSIAKAGAQSAEHLKGFNERVHRLERQLDDFSKRLANLENATQMVPLSLIEAAQECKVHIEPDGTSINTRWIGTAIVTPPKHLAGVLFHIGHTFLDGLLPLTPMLMSCVKLQRHSRSRLRMLWDTTDYEHVLGPMRALLEAWTGADIIEVAGRNLTAASSRGLPHWRVRSVGQPCTESVISAAECGTFDPPEWLIRRAAALVQPRLGLDYSTPQRAAHGSRRVLLIERARGNYGSFFETLAKDARNVPPGFRTDGATRRRIVNHAQVLTALQARYGEGNVLNARLEEGPLPEAQQGAYFRDASLVVAQHGSALVHLIFCRPGTTVVELGPIITDAFARMAVRLGLRYFNFSENVNVAPYDVKKLALLPKIQELVE